MAAILSIQGQEPANAFYQEAIDAFQLPITTSSNANAGLHTYAAATAEHSRTSANS
jgi:hypothetical protein